MLPYLSLNCPFPGVNHALNEPNGLLAAGGDLSIERLILAYSNGIFPWYSPGEPILWWSPDPRTVFFVDCFNVHKSAIKTLKKHSLNVSLNQAFERVIRECAQPRGDENGTWITEEMIEAYCKLNARGLAHSVEVWHGSELVGGIYGVISGSVFCGESMFSRLSNGSKIALSCLVKYLKKFNFKVLDCQLENSHLMSLGATNISRSHYLELLKRGDCTTANIDTWCPQKLHWKELLQVTPNV